MCASPQIATQLEAAYYSLRTGAALDITGIISMRLVMANRQEPITAPQCLREAPDYSPTEMSKKLSGLSLFGGLDKRDKVWKLALLQSLTTIHMAPRAELRYAFKDYLAGI
jgi:hypothetical protein